MGNRGCLHDDEGIIRHRWKGKRWISCVLDYKDNRVPLRKPGRYTPLFFKDEVSALAAGHRPCALCRREAYRAFVAAVERAKGLNPGSLGADDVDAMLHARRVSSRSRQSRWLPDDIALPSGTVVITNGSLFEIDGGKRQAWSWSGFRNARVDGATAIVTPEVIVEALSHGYQPVRWRTQPKAHLTAQAT